MSDRPELRIVGTGQAPACATREEWLAAGARFVETRSSASWDYADWLKAGLDAWGQAALREAETASGNSPEKISNYLAVATTYPPVRRRTKLTFSHHLEVARLAPETAERILDRAEAEGWTRRQTREAAREASPAGEIMRLRRELSRIRRQSKEAELDPRGFAERGRAQLSTQRRLMRDEGRRIASLAEALAASEAIAGLHGSARRGLARDLIRLANAMAANTDAATARLVATADAIKRGA